MLHALERDLMTELPLIADRHIESVFIGGGTPSLLSPKAIESLLKMLKRYCVVRADAEITMEANPGTLECGRLSSFAAAGINRLSLGIQSFLDDSLKRLDRIHSRAEADAAIDQAIKAGFGSVNLDLMHGLPGQTPEHAVADLQRALSFAPQHISWYQLTIEPNTRFYRYPPKLPSEQTLAAIEQAGAEVLASQHFIRYEISAYAISGHPTLHNMNYWQFGDYVGIGPGAHGKLTLANRKVIRRWKLRQPKSYLASDRDGFLAGQVDVVGRELSQEYLMNALRLTQGTEEALYRERTGMPVSGLADWRKRNIASGLLEPTKRLQATPLGLSFLDGLLADF